MSFLPWQVWGLKILEQLVLCMYWCSWSGVSNTTHLHHAAGVHQLVYMKKHLVWTNRSILFSWSCMHCRTEEQGSPEHPQLHSQNSSSHQEHQEALVSTFPLLISKNLFQRMVVEFYLWTPMMWMHKTMNLYKNACWGCIVRNMVLEKAS